MFYYIEYAKEVLDFTAISHDVFSLLCSLRLLVESTSLMRWLSGWWRCFLSSSFNSLTDISPCIFGYLSLMTAVCPLQGRRGRFWFWWRAADCRVGTITLLPQSCLCVDWEAQLFLETNQTVKVKAFPKYQSWKPWWGFNTYGLWASKG